MITANQKKKIQDIVSVFETSSAKPRYDVLVVLHDGPGQRPQVTYGKHQTTEYGNLKALIKMYCDHYGKYADSFKSYLPFIGNPDKPLCNNYQFKHLLKLASEDTTMHEVQDLFFDQYYWNPAMKFFLQNGFTLPLSMLVIYDSFIQSGGIMQKLRERFAERPPAINGGNEKRWICAYTAVRDKFLELNPNPAVRSSDYRTDCLLEQQKNNNWDLLQPVVCKFNQSDSKHWVTVC